MLLAVSALLHGCAGMELTSGRVALSDQSVRAGIVISSKDRKIITTYFARHKQRRKPPPGLAKRGPSLPPGLVKRDTLPKGLNGRTLPIDLDQRLTRLPSAYIRLIIGNDVVLIKRDSRVVMDIYRDFDR